MDHLHLNFEYVAMESSVAARQALKQGHIDMMFTYRNEKTKSTDFVFSDPLFEDAVVGWVTPKQERIPLNKNRWVCWKGTVFCDIAKSLGYPIVEVDNNEGFYKKINAGEAEAAIGLYQSYLYYFKIMILKQRILHSMSSLVIYKRFCIRYKKYSVTKKINAIILHLNESHKNFLRSMDSKYNIHDSPYDKWLSTENIISIASEMTYFLILILIMNPIASKGLFMMCLIKSAQLRL
ncbi:hypothetical protein D1115_03685 [Vibrio alfacsensis]|uniref:Solute-binding protein family 3/N-terminal domain-containing protein n=2 Tax=Vibrio alfacsensis TaxID=1074311 RepID=A0ABM6YSD1_9VIBR|nr:hypothetical protein D1115_03685 [Vibrio alfacsensis]